MNLVLAHCLGRGARHAEPGEFTLRAFLSGRIDLTRAEAVLGVIEASNPAQLDAALEQLAGGLSGPISRCAIICSTWSRISKPTSILPRSPTSIRWAGRPSRPSSNRSGAELAAAGPASGRSRDPESHPRVVLVGPPNVGKSRLFNALLGQDRAIVSPQAGTTRDYLSALCDCEGLTVDLVDTAGIEARRRYDHQGRPRPCAGSRSSGPTSCSFAARPNRPVFPPWRFAPTTAAGGLDQRRSSAAASKAER